MDYNYIVHSFGRTSFCAQNSSLGGATKLKLYHSAPLEMPFGMESFLADEGVNGPWFDFWEFKEKVVRKA